METPLILNQPSDSIPSETTNIKLKARSYFSGYKWTYFISLQDGPLRSRAELFYKTVDWPALSAYGAKSRNEISWLILPDIGLGYNHMVRILEFEDGKRLVARLRMPPLKDSGPSEKALATTISCELNATSLVRPKTDIPTPQIHAFESASNNSVKAPFILIDCLDGNVGMDLGMQIPPRHKQYFLKSLAKIHVSEVPFVSHQICMSLISSLP